MRHHFMLGGLSGPQHSSLFGKWEMFVVHGSSRREKLTRYRRWPVAEKNLTKILGPRSQASAVPVSARLTHR
jgi:hypothetical protein